MDKKKVFISLPMSGKSPKEISEHKEQIIKDLARFAVYPRDIDVIDTFIAAEPPEESNMRLWYLGKTIELLAQADLVVFASDWESARGCRIERECAILYRIPSIVICDKELAEAEK